MVVFERKPLVNNSGRLAFIAIIIFAHYAFLTTIIKIKNKKQLNYLHCLVAFLLYLELCFLLLGTHDNIWIVALYGLIGVFLGLLFFFDAVPDWEDEQTKFEKSLYQHSDDIFHNLTHEELTQLKTANEITKQPANTYGKNTNITIDYQKFDLNNKNIILDKYGNRAN
ncbi:MAG: hypothetical protein IJ187_09795 [Neisseriaceae bacterium]|nr:hypothetical protein [Neisseriaceae bacterium]